LRCRGSDHVTGELTRCGVYVQASLLGKWFLLLDLLLLDLLRLNLKP
jgi:hypothetical protein